MAKTSSSSRLSSSAFLGFIEFIGFRVKSAIGSLRRCVMNEFVAFENSRGVVASKPRSLRCTSHRVLSGLKYMPME